MEKKQGTATSKTFFDELMIQKKRKNLNFRKELAESSSNFHYMEKNQLYESIAWFFLKLIIDDFEQ